MNSVKKSMIYLINICASDRVKLIAFIVFFTIFHFSFSPIITFDTAHYHTYLKVLSHQAPWTEWDIARGIVFPLIIKIAHILFGYSGQGILILMYLFYLALSFTCFNFIKENTDDLYKRYLGYIMVVFFILLDPIIVGYYHTLLTEFIASTIMLITTLYAWKWSRLSLYDNSNYMFLYYSIFFIVMAPLSWHLKQPYVSSVLFPVIGASFISILNQYNLKNFLQRSIVLVLVVLSTGISIYAWNAFLPKEGLANNYSRSSAGFFSKQILGGLNFFQVDENPSHYDVTYIRNDMMIANEDKLKVLDKSSGLNYKIINIYDLKNNLIEQTVLFYSGTEIKSGDSIGFLLKNFIRHPILVIYGYIKNYFGIINVYETKECQLGKFNIKEVISFNKANENDIIAYRVFRVDSTMSNIFYMPDRLYILVEPYKQFGRPPIFFRTLLRVSTVKSNFLFSFIFLLAPFFVMFIILKKIIEKFFHFKLWENKNVEDITFLISIVSFLHVFLHAFFGAIIDRYAFPVYPLMILSIIILVVNLKMKRAFIKGTI